MIFATQVLYDGDIVIPVARVTQTSGSGFSPSDVQIVRISDFNGAPKLQVNFAPGKFQSGDSVSFYFAQTTKTRVPFEGIGLTTIDKNSASSLAGDGLDSSPSHAQAMMTINGTSSGTISARFLTGARLIQ